MKRWLLFYVFYSTACVTVLANDGVVAKVVSVIDGNTIELIASSKKYRVVLADIDCPELGQDFGDEARIFLENLILQKNVTVKFLGKDRSGNFLAVVMVQDDDPRIALLKEGLAWTSEKNPNPDLEPYRTWAEKKGKGLWKQANPTPPWIYKKKSSTIAPKSS